ncbi:MAG: hypothetical protein LBB53_00625, partial [Prevotellaceae bacterium]|nr:hypothetical protein [Prevotellaceae bacterium]
TFTGYAFGPNDGYYQTIEKSGSAILTFANGDGVWEITEQLDLGFDFSFLRGLISGTIDLFQRDTKNMLLDVETPSSVGNRYNVKANVGVVRNRGIEIILAHNKKLKDFSYGIDLNLSFIKNRLIALNGGAPIWRGITKSDLDLPLMSYWGYEYEGVYQTEDEAREYLYGYTEDKRPYHAGDAKYKDRNGDGQITGDDETAIGSNFPWLAGGLTFNAGYKGFDLQLFFQGIYGNKVYNAQRVRLESNGKGSQISTDMRDVYITFSEDHKNALVAAGLNLDDILNEHGTIPNPNGNFNTLISTRFVESGAYLRLKNIELGYTVPAKITKKALISRFRVYVSVSNLFTLTGYKGYDPEVGGIGEDNGNYPQARTLMVGLNLDF